jgi:hypothetical protein
VPGVADLLRLVNGYQTTQAIYAVAALGIPDLLAAGPRSAEELATATGAHAPSLRRVLQALAALDVLHEEADGSFRLGDLGEPLRSDHPQSVAGWAAFVGRPAHWAAWGALDHTVETGENAFRHVHGEDVWRHRESRPEESAAFDRAMESMTRAVTGSVLDAFDFGRFDVIVDVAGGTGAFLSEILARNPGPRGILFDQPHVVANARVPEGVEVVAGSFFEAVPEGGDAYVLKAIVHDWEDEESVAILRSCRRAIAPGGSVLVVERLLGGPNEAPRAKFSDVNMMVAPGGRERTLEEYGTLLDAAGFRLRAETPTSSGHSVIEATPA